MVAARIANLERGGDKRSNQRANLPFDTVSNSDASRLLNVSERSVTAARSVRDHGVPELADKVERGEVSVSAAADVARLEIAENLHRADLTALERAQHVAEWIRLAGDAAQLAPHCKPGQKPGGINAATRDLGIDRTEAQRAVKIDSLTPEAKQAAVETGADRKQSVLLDAARRPARRARTGIVGASAAR